MAEVKLYGTPTCPYCRQAKEFLKQNNIEFEDIDVANDSQQAQQMRQKSGQMSVPVIDIDGQIVVGFDADKLKKLLDI
jgi:glutaredoxin-like YruB-family protein